MKKDSYLNTNGFMLVETLLVSLTIAGILIYMYAQFSIINDTYQKLYNYNTTESLYHTDVVKQFLMNYTVKKTASGNLYTTTINSNKAFDITNCSIVTGNDKSYCEALVKVIKANQIILTEDNLTESTKTKIITVAATKSNDVVVKSFLKQIESVNEGKYRLIVIYEDGTIATVLFMPEVE